MNERVLLLGAIGGAYWGLSTQASSGMTTSTCGAAAQLIRLSASASSFPGAPHPYTLVHNVKDVHRTQSRRQNLINILPCCTKLSVANSV